MKKLVSLGLLMIIAGIVYFYKDDIVKTSYSFVENKVLKVELKNKNAYYRDYDFEFVQNTTNFSPKNKQDILNIFYTVLNSGESSFSFYCPNEYKNCTNEISNLAKDQITLSNINNYVHPYNSFKNISTQTDTLGKVTIKIEKNYTDQDIKLINTTIKNIEEEIFDDNLSTVDQVKVIHDYIITKTKYDSNRTDNGVEEYKSDIAYGPLIEGYGICGGYSDAMELFLEDLHVKSFKVSSDAHVWNAVNIYENSWHHIDLTWDDPVTNTGIDLLDNTFFMIDTPTLQQKEQTQHNFDKEVFKEVA